MAEVLGIVASGVAVGQLAGEVTSSIIKLKGYWDQVKDAPGEIRQLLLEIDSLNPILRHIEQDQNRTGLSELSPKIYVKQSLKLCKQGAEELSGLVSELAMKIDKTGWRRKAGASKVVLKREEIKKLKRRMKNAIRLLSLAYQCHTNEIIRLQPDIIVARISDKMNSISEAIASGSRDSLHITPELENITGVTGEGTSAAENYNLINALYHVWISSPIWINSLIGSLQYWSRYETSEGRQTLEVSTRYRCPSWLSNRAWDARYLSENSEWKFHLQTYPVLPWNHDIFAFARTGNITGLRLMLVESRSYVTARMAPSGGTPLHIAIHKGQPEVCKLLLDVGADPSAEDDRGVTPIQRTCRFRPQKAGDDSMIINLCRLLINAGASDSEPLYCQKKEEGDSWYREYGWYCGSPALFQFLQRQMCPRYHELPMKDRLEFIRPISFFQCESALDIFRLALGSTSFNREMLAATDDDGWTVLHWIGLALSDTKCTGLKPCHISGQAAGCLLRHRPCHSSNHCGWSALLRDVLSAGSLLHAVDYSGKTPLCALLSRFGILLEKTEYWNRDVKMIQYLSCTLYTWIYDLNASGIDLQQYGELETALGLKVKANSSRRLDFREEKFHILGFSYGPTVEDWKFWFSEPTDYLAGKFWAMIEKSSSHSDSYCTIPGSWPKDIELSESDSESD